MHPPEIEQVGRIIEIPPAVQQVVGAFTQAYVPLRLAAGGGSTELNVGTVESLGMTSDWKRQSAGFRHVREMTQNWSDRCNACSCAVYAASTDVRRFSTPAQDCHFYGMYAVSTTVPMLLCMLQCPALSTCVVNNNFTGICWISSGPWLHL